MAAIAESPRDRLTEAAQEIFAERGYAAASVRDICKRAAVNVAAVNYYFGDKERLYVEAVKAAHSCISDEPPMPEWSPGTPPWDRLRDFIRVMVTRMVRETNPHATHLIMREMAQPTAACIEVVRDYIRPSAEVLRGILKELCPQCDDEESYLLGFSIMGQVLIYKQSRPVIRLLMGQEAFDALEVERIARHIYEFSRGGIERRQAGGRA
ncbi:MAG: CerR family C-terminal domain-containing protein [Gemmataceae bacterium]|nr:CerR family C-terminal domain-containing protein [Gemmataceae bacterium]